MMQLAQALPTFIAESHDLLAEMSAALQPAHDGAAAPADAVHAVFRAAHTIKGSAGLFSLDHVVAFTHVVESVLDQLRDRGAALEAPLASLLLACCDHISAMIDGVAEGHCEPGEALARRGATLVDQLQGWLGAAPLALTASAPADEAGAARCWHLSLRFGADVLRLGMDPLSFLRYLGGFGRLTSLHTLADALPAPALMDPEACYLGFEFDFETTAGRAAIEAAFEFVRDDCVLALTPLEPAVAALAATLLPPAAAPAPQQARAPDAATVRVDAGKLDHLIDLVGELIIAGAGVGLIARDAEHGRLRDASARLSALVEAVRDSALQLRMVKIGATFHRFQRVVREVARELDKDIVLLVRGEDAELDKTLVEKIADPLLHLVRNAIDHGIEPTARRLAAGKSARATLRLNAYHESGSIVIEVSDDGGGLDRERILARALQRGLVDAEHKLSDSEICQLIFAPGFSTADQVTELSGRGVGMDVVKRNIAALRGSVELASKPGAGTTVTVRLPLTLAIIDAFLVGLGAQSYVIPLDAIEECVAFALAPGQDYADLRGRVLPCIRLRRHFGVAGTPPRRESVVVLHHGGQRFGLVVDALLGECQAVIKPLSPVFSAARCISGSTVLGSGEVALILDVAALCRQGSNRTPRLAPELTLPMEYDNVE